MPLSDKILTILQPSMPLEEVFVADTETLEGNPIQARKDSLVSQSAMVGDITPFVQIEDYVFTYDEIAELTIDETGFLPLITVNVIDYSGTFGAAYFPTTRPILKMYIRSKDETLKPIRNDYLITKITSLGYLGKTGASEGRGIVYSIRGQLFIPKMHEALSKVYPNMSSFDTLLQLAKEMNIGFATNEDQTNDRMNWLAPYWKHMRFISHVTNHSYKDDDSFYASYIDKYYNLNFINLKGMLSQEYTFEDIMATHIGHADYLRNDKSGEGNSSQQEMPLILSNSSHFNSSPLFINSYTPSSMQGSIIINNGVEGYIYYYDSQFDDTDPANNFIGYPISEFKSIELEDDTIGKRYAGYWEGIDYGNTHENYIYATLNNYRNVMELYKNKLDIVTDGINFNVYKGMRIPIMIVKEGEYPETQVNSMLPPNTNESDDEEINDSVQSKIRYRVDKYLTGYYVVTGIKYKFNAFSGNRTQGDRQSFSSEISLSRETWTATPEFITT